MDGAPAVSARTDMLLKQNDAIKNAHVLKAQINELQAQIIEYQDANYLYEQENKKLKEQVQTLMSYQQQKSAFFSELAITRLNQPRTEGVEDYKLETLAAENRQLREQNKLLRDAQLAEGRRSAARSQEVLDLRQKLTVKDEMGQELSVEALLGKIIALQEAAQGGAPAAPAE